MGEYIVSARKYRPTTFADVVGQKALTATLRNAVRTGKLAHAYLFCGPRGVGKTTCARIFAKAINCTEPHADGEACGHCDSCRTFDEQRSLNIFELDAASNNSVENIKTLMEQTRIPPQTGRYKVFIIDEVHMLSTAAFNAFLKTLEEPPAHVIFILATTEKHKILPTIISRCQIYDFERMGVQDTIDHLKTVAAKEGVTADDEALALIATKADGGMRDALSMFDQAVSYCQGRLTYELVASNLNVLDADNYFRIVDYSLENKAGSVMLLLNDLIAKGFDGGNIVNGLASHIRNVMMAKDESTTALIEASEQQRARYAEQARRCPVRFLYKALKTLNQCDVNYRQSSNKRLLAELTLIQVAQITQPDDADDGSAGRSPKRLKTLFSNIMLSRNNAVGQVAAGKAATRVANRADATRRNDNEATANAAETVHDAAATTQKTAPVARIKAARGIGNTFSRLMRESKDSAAAKEPEITVVGENEHFDDEQLATAWMQMCNRMPKSYLGLASRMKNMKPHIGRYPGVELVVDNENLLKKVTEIRGRIRATLAERLHNGALQITIRLAEADELKPLLSRKEIFEKMKEQNEAVRLLSRELNLDLA